MGLRGGTASDLLDTELAQLGLQFLQLLGEVILALSPELTSLDLGRLQIEKLPSAFHFFHAESKTANSSMAHSTYHGGRLRVVSYGLST